MKLACRCGQVQGEVEPRRAYTRASCYCRDCRAFARWLGGDGLLDASGGTDIVPMAPDGLRFTRGHEQLACMSLGPGGLLRWYARCCRTPLGNVPRDPRFHYLGLPVAALAEPAASIDAAFGPGQRIALDVKSATGKVSPTRLALLGGMLRIIGGLLASRLRGRRDAVFFEATGDAPIRAPEVLTLAQRQALGSG